METALLNLSSLTLQYYALDRVTVGPWWDYRDVISPFTRLFCVLDGEATIHHSHFKMKLTAGDLVLTPPFMPVTYQCSKHCDNVFMIFTCQMEQGRELFSMPLLQYQVSSFSLAETYALRLVDLNPDMKLSEVDPWHPQYNAYLWHAEQKRPQGAAQMESQGLFRLLLAPFVASLDMDHAFMQPHRLHTVMQYIDQNLDQALSLELLASVCNLHPTYLSDLFTRIVGMRPIAYINQRRIEKAQLALVVTNQPVKRIAFDVGIPDPNYFSRLFKKHTGQSPAAYRTNHR